MCSSFAKGFLPDQIGVTVNNYLQISSPTQSSHHLFSLTTSVNAIERRPPSSETWGLQDEETRGGLSRAQHMM